MKKSYILALSLLLPCMSSASKGTKKLNESMKNLTSIMANRFVKMEETLSNRIDKVAENIDSFDKKIDSLIEASGMTLDCDTKNNTPKDSPKEIQKRNLSQFSKKKKPIKYSFGAFNKSDNNEFDKRFQD